MRLNPGIEVRERRRGGGLQRPAPVALLELILSEISRYRCFISSSASHASCMMALGRDTGSPAPTR
jgi:hypothetical protein